MSLNASEIDFSAAGKLPAFLADSISAKAHHKAVWPIWPRVKQARFIFGPQEEFA